MPENRMTLIARLSVAVLLGASGAAVMVTLGWVEDAVFGELPFVAYAFAGAFSAGVLTAQMFGRDGESGVTLAICGAVLATVLGVAFVAGAVAPNVIVPNVEFLEMLKFVFGAVLIVLLLILTTVAFPVWIVAMLGGHLAAKHLRKAA